ncbi:MAG TPA: beta-ketoacyl synthase N-terminal-like domain-containing protein [Polyangiaceae bacterium]|jgi:3-oxoacyl-(acyl-carrier-protein) synthase|nr:beta-ketoacyl synthase N-terminal-like domain-containing protein [Polyangiaceae bacterium]
MRRVAIFGWGIVAPKAPTLDVFRERLDDAKSWLTPFNGFGPDNFMVGTPEFDFARYQPWLEQRFPPSRFKQLTDKMDPTTLFAIGAFIQALGANEGLEAQLSLQGPQTHVYVSTALGAIPTLHEISLTYYRAQRRWNRFWSAPERNSAIAEAIAGNSPWPEELRDPAQLTDPDEREQAEDVWFAHWASRSPALADYLEEFRQIESLTVEGDIESAKLGVIREKRRRLSALAERWKTPEPPWNCVSANVLWNIANTPASQISMLGHITGPCFAPVAACSTFGVTLHLGMQAISSGKARFAVIGSADPAPHPITVGAFYNARVLAADGAVSKPLSGLKGTHVAGGSCIWILGDLEYGLSKGFKPLGLEPLAVGLSADADHIITPSKEGPKKAIHAALEQANVTAGDLVSWDLHATATPGDYQEVDNLRGLLSENVLITARKGIFGHGMGVGGGWELTAQFLGVERGKLFPTPLEPSELNQTIKDLGQRFVFNQPVPVPRSVVGKLSMGVGGINSCVISRSFRGPAE